VPQALGSVMAFGFGNKVTVLNSLFLEFPVLAIFRNPPVLANTLFQIYTMAPGTSSVAVPAVVGPRDVKASRRSNAPIGSSRTRSKVIFLGLLCTIPRLLTLSVNLGSYHSTGHSRQWRRVQLWGDRG
jgi:hypothetical protein